ncbi:tetraacyldisaccharide 4'-kinase [Holospora obtusa F1]|uniref:Tetraacyldisaccharide 4'-kinase n=1 Tax=Holospora obtusa F1 TaxID=1399147 RepID=W6TGD2_HOLOB|nr:tetraacyldisaccharide 4'-kinase [Holospora obtusa]ETZ06905.1 tetraacyldisaccharide 4'-kinase [Holospora obtusa F1]
MKNFKNLEFWKHKPGKTFQVISFVYQIFQCLYEWMRTPCTPFHMNVPVISVGGLTLGGAGKTPCTLSLAEWLSNLGHDIIILTRGYKGRAEGPIWVGVSDTPYSVGEEAWIMAQHFPVLISKDILKGALYLQNFLPSNKNTVILWDDGHQYPKLYKNIALIVSNTQQWFGNTWVFPAGPLRESLEGGMQRAHGLIILYSKEPKKLPGYLVNLSIPCWSICCQPVCDLPINTPVVGFCGLGNPERFWETITQCELNLKAHLAFPDHYFYKPKDEQYLIHLANKHHAVLVTSHKDYVKLSPAMQAVTHQIFQKISWPLEAQHMILRMLKFSTQ